MKSKLNNTNGILFLPSNKNHVLLFKPIYEILKEKCQVVFLTQGSYKNEGADEKLTELNIQFKTLDDYKKKDPTFILTREGIKVVVIGNDIDIIPQWFVNSASKLKIKSVLIQDGMLFEVHKNNKSFVKKLSNLTKHSSQKLFQLAVKLKLSNQYGSITYGESNCTQIHVWGNQAKSYLLSKGIEKNKIVITGNPKIFPKKIENNSLNEKNNAKRILYVPTDLVHTEILNEKVVLQMVDDLCSAVTSVNNTELIIRPHPREETNFYNPILETIPLNKDLIQKQLSY